MLWYLSSSAVEFYQCLTRWYLYLTRKINIHALWNRAIKALSLAPKAATANYFAWKSSTHLVVYNNISFLGKFLFDKPYISIAKGERPSKLILEHEVLWLYPRSLSVIHCFFKAKFFNIGGMHCINLVIGIHKSQSKLFNTFKTIVFTRIVMAIEAITIIKTNMAIQTNIAIKTVKPIVIIIKPSYLFLDLFGLKPGIKYKKRISRLHIVPIIKVKIVEIVISLLRCLCLFITQDN